MRRLLAKSKTTRGPACRRSPAAPPFVRGRHLSFFAETKAAERPRRSGRPVCGLLPLRPHPRLPLPAAAQRRRGQRRLGVSSIRDYQHPPPLCGGGDRDGSAVFPSLKKIFSFFSRTIDFCAAQGFILFSTEKSGASPNGACASAASYTGCKYKAFGKPFCGARKGRKHKKSHLSLGVPLAERTNAGNSRSE